MSKEERYDIQGKIGEGGRGAVYLARDKQLNRTVAIKRLFSEEGSAEKDYEAVLHESRALSAINSPHIVRVYDVCQDDEGPYVVMEHLEGRNLHEVVSNAPLVEHDFLEIAEQGLEALIAAHEVQLLHRDIKPGNLMLTWLPSGRFNLKLLDFGLAKFSSQPAVQTMAHGNSVMGSIYFMAPEQFDRKPLDQRTDLYSLGCVFFFALTGEFPFDGANVTEVMAAHIQGHHKDLHAIRPDLPRSLCEWVTHFISVDAADRPADAQVALESLAEAKRGSFTRVPPQPLAPHLFEGPVDVGPPTGAVPRASIHSTDHVLAARAPNTASVPVVTRARPASPSVPRPPVRTSTIPTGLLITMGVLAVLVLVLGAAIYFLPDDPAAPAPATRGIPAADRPGKPGPAAAKPAGRPPNRPSAGPAKPAPRPAGRNKPANAIPPSRKQLMATFKSKDTNHDGRITQAEWVSDREAPGAKARETHFKSLDRNKDGKLTPEEFLLQAKGRSR